MGADGGSYKIFVINLDRSTGRLKRLEFEFGRAGIKFERIPAVDGNKLSEDQILRHYSPELNRRKYFAPLTRPEIGVYMSHLKTCERIISEDLDFGIVLEDDIVLKDGFWMVPKVLGSLKTEWNYIKLIAPGRRKRVSSREPVSADVPIEVAVERHGEKETRTLGIPVNFELVTWNKVPIGASAYAVTRNGAREFISKRSVFFRPVDVDLQFGWETALDIRGLSPFMLGLLGDKSTVQTCKLKYHYPLARVAYKLKYAFRRYSFQGKKCP